MNQLWLHMLSKVLCVVFVWIAILVPGDLSAGILPPPEDTVRLVDDPEALPYRFKERTSRLTTPNGQVGFNWAFMEPERRESDGVFQVQHSWSPVRGLSGIIYASGLTSSTSLKQENVRATRLEDWLCYDADDDGEPEFAAVYVRDDTLWLWRVDPGDDTRSSTFIATGKDINGDGRWDGVGQVRLGEDFDGDGVAELFVTADCGYDLKPRALHLVNGATGEIEWRYDIASNITWVDVFPGSGGRRIGVALASRGNDVSANGMDDSHTYLLMLDSLGQRLWWRELGGKFGPSRVITYDIGHDSTAEIVAMRRYEVVQADGDTLLGGAMLALDTEGNVLDSLDLGIGHAPNHLKKMDLDCDGAVEPVVTTMSGRLYVCDDSLRVTQSAQFEDHFVSLVASGDFIGNNETQIVASPTSSAWILLDAELELLAQVNADFGCFWKPTFRSKSQPDRLSLVVEDVVRGRAVVLGIVPNPWYTVFFRKPWLAAAAGGAPLLVIAGVIALSLVSVRRKNRVIAQTNSQLQTAMRQLREAQARLVVAEKYKQARDIAGGFAHEIRNALVPIEGVLQRVQHHSKGSEKAEKITNYCRMGERSLDDALSLTEQIGKYAKLEATKEEQSVELMGLIGEVVETNRVAAENAGVTVRVEGPGEALVRSNRQQLQVVLTNLLRNSLDALTNQGDGSILFAVRRENQSTFLTVTDNGPGIPAADADRVFEMFYSTKPDTGTGIGLAMVRKIVELYDGEIRLDAARGPGATFVIRLKED
jgi:signal transduction histidine kinase